MSHPAIDQTPAPTTQEVPPEASHEDDPLAWLRQLEERIAARNHDLTEEQAEAIAEEITQAAITSMVERGEISFERDRT